MNRKFTPSAYRQIIENTDSVSPKQLKKYLEGKLSEKEAHQVEKQLINCSFATEALEGYQQNKALDPTEIAKKLAQDIDKYNRERGFGDGLPTLSNWLRLGSVAAAGLFLVGFVGLIYWQMQGIVYKAEQQNAATALKQSTQAQEAPLLADAPAQTQEAARENENQNQNQDQNPNLPEKPQQEQQSIAQAEPNKSEIDQAQRAAQQAQQAQREATQTPTVIETDDFTIEKKKEKSTDQKDTSGDKTVLKNPEKFTLTQAYQFYQRGEFGAASQLFDFFLTKNPKNAELLFHAAHAHLLNKNHSRAATLFEQLLTQKAELEASRVEESRYYLALAYVELAKKEQAREILQDLVRKKGSFAAKAQQKLNDL
ncbi:tetratricopeptide repeat protein [Hugenholtzia roseola]|uniref:tetratricopeptide repeat protein n=1 Tax=Hugenholtzia roseola TaxID=1002 RepID=UPI0004291730|nr:hypothetical protein [Hugenholtzia roseola]